MVVNRTLFAIDDLIRNKPTVREHLRKTIQFYLKTGTLPTLAQLSNPLSARLSLMPGKALGPINGLDTVGCGFNILSMERKVCVLDQTNFTEQERWSDPFNRSLTYSLPDGWFAVNTPESLSLDAAVFINSAEDYFRRTTTSTVYGQSLFFFFRTFNEKTTTELYRRFYQQYYNLILRMKQIAWYTLSVRAFPYPKLSPMAQTAFDRLPTNFSLADLKVWQDFFDVFGTHLVVSSTMGGQVWAETWYEQCLAHERSQQWVQEQAGISWRNWKLPTRQTEQYQQQLDERFRQHSTTSLQLLGGNEQIQPFDWDQWVASVKTRARPISYRLITLAEILPESDQRAALSRAIDYVVQSSKTRDQTYINQLQSIRGPPKKECSRTEMRIRRLASTANEETMRKELCPSIGYKGKECLGKKLVGRALIAEGSPQVSNQQWFSRVWDETCAFLVAHQCGNDHRYHHRSTSHSCIAIHLSGNEPLERFVHQDNLPSSSRCRGSSTDGCG